MPRNHRYALPGYAYHVTQRGTDRQKVFRQAGDREVYLDLLRDQRQDSGVSRRTYWLMSNHVHLIVTPEHGDSLAVLFRRVHGFDKELVDSELTLTLDQITPKAAAAS